MDIKHKRVAVISPVAWRTPPRAYGAWETVASNITEGLVRRGWSNVTLYATGDSQTAAELKFCVDRGYEEDGLARLPQVSTVLHISQVMEQADQYDLIHNNFDYVPLTYSRLINTPILTTIHGFSDPDLLRVYHKYRDSFYVSISDSDRDPGLRYLATVYNGIDIDAFTFREEPGEFLVCYGRIHPDKGVHLAIQVARQSRRPLIIAGIIQDQGYFDESIGPHLDGELMRYIGPVTPEQRDGLLGSAFAVLHLNTIPERFGLVLVESMAAGVPVIAMDLGSCAEIVKDRETGFLVNDVSEAVTAVTEIGQLTRADCRRHVQDNFTIDHMVSAYERVYEQIFARTQPGEE